jgi:hypothetical protein
MVRRTQKRGNRKKSQTSARKSTSIIDSTEEHVRVRMYRVGFGECFLLTFPRVGRPFHMLIDCGMYPRRQPNAPTVLQRVVRDICACTGGHLDVLVVTHRHIDHINGFYHAADTFKRMNVEQAWLGWTEDAHSAEYRELERRGYRALGNSRPGAAGTNYQAMSVVRSIARTVRYLRGGEGPVALAGVPGARVFFWAPPTPNADLAAVLRATTAKSNASDCPFDERYRNGFEQARNDPQFDRYFRITKDEKALEGSPADEPEWRQIGPKLVERVPRLQLGAMSALNDTSLVMAIELTARSEKKVLLFPGDAMIASWWSWHEHRWLKNDPEAVTCATLLQNTVLYKVSHKGSASGTAIRFGLEMMNHPDLVAMLSIDESVAKKIGWQLPAPSLMAALVQKTHGRIIRSDLGMPPAKRKASELADSEWRRFLKSAVVNALYIDHYVGFPQPSAEEQEQSESNWTAANERRVYLIDKKLAGTIRPEEESELREIEKLFDEYMSTTSPTGLTLLTQLRETLEQTKRSSQ